MSKKGCELCGNLARMFCESDQASLCRECDQKVHAANFLVAKHSRTLLCHLCSSPTPWKATGLNLGPTVSVCMACAEHGVNRGAPTSIVRRREEIEDREEDCDSLESESGDSCSDSEEEEEEEEDGENQVVPWSASPESPSSSSTEEGASYSSLKRVSRDESEDEDGYYLSTDLEFSEGNCRSAGSREDYDSASVDLLRPMKIRRMGDDDSVAAVAGRHAPAKSSSGTAAIIDKLRRLHRGISS